MSWQSNRTIRYIIIKNDKHNSYSPLFIAGIKNLGPPDLVHIIKNNTASGKHPKEVTCLKLLLVFLMGLSVVQ